MTRALAHALTLSLAASALAGCSTVQSVLDEGRGPFGKSPASTSMAALEGLHESSWGNSGKWEAREGLEADAEQGKAGTEPGDQEGVQPASDPPDAG